jgi:hypothetical protein
LIYEDIGTELQTIEIADNLWRLSVKLQTAHRQKGYKRNETYGDTAKIQFFIVAAVKTSILTQNYNNRLGSVVEM